MQRKQYYIPTDGITTQHVLFQPQSISIQYGTCKIQFGRKENVTLNGIDTQNSLVQVKSIPLRILNSHIYPKIYWENKGKSDSVWNYTSPPIFTVNYI